MIVEIPLTGLYQSGSPVIADIECSNWYINKPQTSGTQSASTLLGTPGLTEYLNAGEGTSNICRGAHTKNEIPYFVCGNTLYSITQTFNDSNDEVLTLNDLGTIEGSGFVSMSDNGTQLMILVPNGKGYIYNEDEVTPLVEITDTDFTANGAPQYVTFVDSFFIVTTDQKKFIKSASNDGTDWNALDFATAEADPDKIVAPIVFSNRLYIMGSEIGEAFQNLGIGGFPFQRINGAIINKGVFSPLSLVQTSNGFLWIGGGVNESPAVWMSSGGAPEKISNTAIDSELQNYTSTELDNSFAWSYAQKGAYFVGFSLPTKTFVYDMVSGEWHERRSVFMSGEFTQDVRWRVNAMTTAYGRVFVGDSQDGRIGVIEPETYNEYGQDIIRTFSAPMIQANGNPISTSELELLMESGVANDTATDPQIRMDYSDDGKTWSDEMFRSMGKIGQYMNRVIWSRLGRTPYFRIFRFQMSDQVKPVVIKLTARLKGGNRG